MYSKQVTANSWQISSDEDGKQILGHVRKCAIGFKVLGESTEYPTFNEACAFLKPVAVDSLSESRTDLLEVSEGTKAHPDSNNDGHGTRFDLLEID